MLQFVNVGIDKRDEMPLPETSELGPGVFGKTFPTVSRKAFIIFVQRHTNTQTDTHTHRQTFIR